MWILVDGVLVASASDSLTEDAHDLSVIGLGLWQSLLECVCVCVCVSGLAHTAWLYSTITRQKAAKSNKFVVVVGPKAMVS